HRSDRYGNGSGARGDRQRRVMYIVRGRSRPGASDRGNNNVRYEQRLIWVLGITFGFLFFDRNASSFLMPFITKDLGFNYQQVGLIASALSFTWAVSAFLGGALSDRTG